MRRARSGARAGWRRGFALPMVILLSLVAAISVAVILQRQDAQTRTVESLLADYQTHHASFGVRAVVKKWVTRQKAEDLVNLASEGGVAHRFILPEQTFVSVAVRDGQGVPTVISSALGPTTQQYYIRVRERVEAVDPDLVRNIGPPAISVNAAPEVVLAALIADEDDGQRLAERLSRQRERRPLTRDDVLEEFRRIGLADSEVTNVLAILTFEPALWSIDVAVESGNRQLPARRFEMVVEAALNAAKVHRWAEVIERAPGEEDGPEPDGGSGEGEAGRQRGSDVRESLRGGSR